MYQAGDVFSGFHIRKTPIITYRRKQTNSVPLNNKPHWETPPAATLSSSSLRPTGTKLPFTEKRQPEENQENEEQQSDIFDLPYLCTTPTPSKDVFDLPDEDSTQVELRVASSLHRSGNSNLRQSLKKPNNINTAAGNKKKTKSLTSEIPPKFTRTQSAPTTFTVNPNSITVATKSGKTATAIATPFVHYAPKIQTKPSLLPEIKKRKRNFISRLRSANGDRMDSNESQSTGLRFYDLSDDERENGEDDDQTFPYRSVSPSSCPQESLSQPNLISQSPSLSTDDASNSISMNYNEQMEQEIAALMTSEFGDDLASSETPSSPLSHLPSYKPKTARAPVTYKRSNKLSASPSPSSSSLTSATHDPLDLDINRQIEYLLSHTLQ